MRQAWHIFLKDLRAHRWETGVCLLLTISVGWNEIHSWTTGELGARAFGVGGLFTIEFWSRMAPALLVFAWAFLILRAAHAESLVGDRQFWITRPYEWGKLLGAKFLFVFALVNLPLFLLDVYLLWRAGFAPHHYFAGLLWMQLGLLVMLILPFLALVSVTATLAQSLLAFLIVALYMAGMSYLSDKIPSSSFSGSSDVLSAVLLVAASVAIIVLQYARRRTATARWLIVGLGGILLLILAVTPYGSIVANHWPALKEGERPGFDLTLMPARSGAPVGFVSPEKDEVSIRLPLAVSGIASDEIVRFNGVLVRVGSVHEVNWDSGWQTDGREVFPETRIIEMSFKLPRQIYERLDGAPATVAISFAVTRFRDANRREFSVPDAEFSIPEAGTCAERGIDLRSVRCMAPLHGPSSLLVTADASKLTCSVTGRDAAAPKPGDLVREWTYDADPGPADFGIVPLHYLNITLTSEKGAGEWRFSDLCPGTPVVLSNPKRERAYRTQVTFDGLRFSNYRELPMRASFQTTNSFALK
jgi:hypothetical protein